MSVPPPPLGAGVRATRLSDVRAEALDTDRHRRVVPTGFAALDRILVGGLRTQNLTIIGGRPRVAPHRQAMRASLAALLQLPIDAVSVKATTTEGLGFAGRGEGLAASAAVLLAGSPEKPEEND